MSPPNPQPKWTTAKQKLKFSKFCHASDSRQAPYGKSYTIIFSFFLQSTQTHSYSYFLLRISPKVLIFIHTFMGSTTTDIDANLNSNTTTDIDADLNLKMLRQT